MNDVVVERQGRHAFFDPGLQSLSHRFFFSWSRVNWLITNHLPIINVIGALSQALEIIFEVQRKTSNEKITRKKKKLVQLTKRFFFFSSLDLSYFQTS
jgi:hypothetical protein